MKRRTMASLGVLGLVVLLLILLGGWLAYRQYQDRQLPFETIDLESGGLGYSGEDSGLMVITQPDEIMSSGLDMRNPPVVVEQFRTVDYQRAFVLVVFQGLKGSGGFSIEVQRIWRVANDVYVQAEFVEPRPDSRVTLGFTSPYHVVAVSKDGTWQQTVRFVLLRGTTRVAETTHFIP